MEKVFQKISALLLALLVLVATSSFQLSMHFCGEHLVSYSLTDTVKNCGGSFSKISFTKTKISKKSCCSDKFFIKQAQDELSQKDLTTSLFKKNLDFINHFYKTESSFNIPFLSKKITYLCYSPPLLLKDRTVLFKSFLI